MSGLKMPTSSVSLRRLRGHGQESVVLAEATVAHTHEGHHSPILVVHGVEDERPGSPVGVSFRRWDPLHHRFEHLQHALAGLGRDMEDVGPRATDDRGDLIGPLLRFRSGQVDLVEHRDYLQVVLEGKESICQGLRLDPLGGVDHQDGALAGGQAAGYLVGEVHVARRVDEVELILAAVLGPVVDAHGLGLDGDAPLALQVHAVEDLVAHLPLGHRVGDLQDAVGQGRLAVVDVGDYREIADVLEASHGGSILAYGARGAARPRAGGPPGRSGRVDRREQRISTLCPVCPK